MAKEETLAKVQADIERGDLGMARERLGSLIVSYPDDLSLRSKLADVHYRLQMPSQAGRFWYLDEPVTDEMRVARAAFEASHGKHSRRIAQALMFRGNIEEVVDPFARATLEQLLPFAVRQERDLQGADGGATWAIGVAVSVFLLLVAGTFIVGIVTVFRWIF